MEIPSTHWSMVFRGKSGTGKTTMIARVVKRLAEEQNFGIIVVCSSKLKHEDTYGVYDEVLGKDGYKKYKGITHAMVRRLRNHIVIIEDTPMYIGSSGRRKKLVKDLVSALARANRVITILVTQVKIGMSLPLNVRLVLRVPNYQYRVTESRNSSSWFNWTGKKDSVDPILDAIYNGVEGEELGDVGRPTDSDSEMQRLYRLFDEGKTPKEINNSEGNKPQSPAYCRTYTYWAKWKNKQSRKVSINDGENKG